MNILTAIVSANLFSWQSMLLAMTFFSIIMFFWLWFLNGAGVIYEVFKFLSLVCLMLSSIFIGVPVIVQVAAYTTVSHTQILRYNGTLSVVSFTPPTTFFGCTLDSGSSKLTFEDGKTWSFSGNLELKIGFNYTIVYQLTTYNDSHTSISPINITLSNGAR